MEHATALDLVSFEDPVFYDKMERARRQTTARLGMLAGLAGMAQQLLTLASLLSAVIFFYPWLLLLLVAAPSRCFLGETRFAMLNYSMLYRYTPERRELDYLRYLGASNESAKEVKIFGLGKYLAERSRTLFERFYAENRHLAIQRALHGGLLNLAPDRRILCGLCLDLAARLGGANDSGRSYTRYWGLRTLSKHYGKSGGRTGRHFRASIVYQGFVRLSRDHTAD